MPDPIYIADVRERARVPESGILSQTLQDGAGTKIVLFGFAAGQELSAHTAPFPAIVTILQGRALLRLGDQEHEAGEGSFAYMPAHLEHAIRAQTGVVMLLTMIKGAPA
jgi:quercetin dioxygenase-like cupin family protein